MEIRLRVNVIMVGMVLNLNFSGGSRVCIRIKGILLVIINF